MGMPFYKIIGPKNKEGGGSELEKRIKKAADSVVNFETTYIAKDGREIPVNFSASVMRDEEGKEQGIVCDGGDITEWKRVDEERQKYMAELERFNRLAVGRELKMIELKKEMNRLCERLGEKPRYDISFVDDNKITNYEIRNTGGKKENEKG